MEMAELESYIEFVQGFHPALEYTFNITDHSLPFLDIAIQIECDYFKTSIHYKPTDTHSYLLFHSNHSPACKRSIPFSQFLRLRRLCSDDDDDDFHAKALEMKSFFLSRDYPSSLIDNALLRTSNVNRETLLHRDSRSSNHTCYTQQLASPIRR